MLEPGEATIMRRTTILIFSAALLLACGGPSIRPTADAPAPAAASDPGVSIEDLAGNWKLVELPRGTPVPDDVEVTLAFDGTKASGTSGCNRYSGTIEEKEPGELEPGLFSGTQMFCEGPGMDVEKTYLHALGMVRQYTFMATRLEVTYETDEGGMETMVFVRGD